MLDRLKALAAPIQHYWLIISTLGLAVFSIVLLRKNGQIADLQRQIIENKLDNQLTDALNKAEEDTNDYNQSIEKYHRLKDSYNKLYNQR